jgi:hypothetical protein
MMTGSDHDAAMITDKEQPDVLQAPCVFCGYKGDGYWQAGTHDLSCPWRGIGGEQARLDAYGRVVFVRRLLAAGEYLKWL